MLGKTLVRRAHLEPCHTVTDGKNTNAIDFRPCCNGIRRKVLKPKLSRVIETLIVESIILYIVKYAIEIQCVKKTKQLL